jgi:hypothetical protein
MSALIAAEWTKLRHRWMPRVLVLIMLVILALLFWGNGTDQSARRDLIMPHAWVMSLVFSAVISPFIWPVLGGSWAGSEYGWGTIRMVLSRRPDRIQFVLAGLLILTVFVALSLIAALIVGSLAGIVVALLTGHSIFNSSEFNGTLVITLIKVFFASWYVLLFFLALSYAAGTLFRSSAVGIGVGIGITLADFIISGIFYNLGGRWRDIALHFPGIYTRTLPTSIAQKVLFQRAGDVTNPPGVTESIIALGLYIAIPVILALVLVRVRDVTS